MRPLNFFRLEIGSISRACLKVISRKYSQIFLETSPFGSTPGYCLTLTKGFTVYPLVVLGTANSV